jgi:protein-disulfide isomerase
MKTRICSLVFVAVVLSALPLSAGQAAATVGGEAISLAELERAAAVRLLQVHTEMYELRRAEIEKRIGELVIAQRAGEENLSPAAWLDREAAGQMRAITSAEVEEAFKTLTGPERTKPKEEALASLERDMRQARRLEVSKSIVRQLRKKAIVDIRLESPRLDRNDLGGIAVHGPDDAPVTMVVFEDFQCPGCAALSPVLAELREHYPETLRILHRDSPLSIHQDAKAAAEAANCAAEQGRFWQMAEALYAHAQSLNRPSFEQFAADAGLDRESFASCLDSGRQSRSWKEGLSAAREAGLRGTPTVFINGRLLTGARPFQAYMDVIEEELQRNR